MKRFVPFIKQLQSNIVEASTTIEHRIVYFVSFYGMISGLFFVFFFDYIGFDVVADVMAAMIAMVVGAAYLLYRYNMIKRVSYFLVSMLSFCFVPLLFFLTGDIYNGAALFFVVCIILTFFVIKERVVYLIALLEILLYSYITFLPLAYPDRFVKMQEMSRAEGSGIVVSFAGAVIIPIFIISFQTFSSDKIHKELEESNKLIEEAKYNKSRFLANMTHEIRTPMNAIVGMNELILREELDTESRELAEAIKSSSNQLLKIINNILEFSKLESKKLEFNLQKYDFRKMISGIIDVVSGEYANDDSEFYVDIDPNIPAVLFGDETRIKQVFMYILFSAIHKLPHSRITLKISGDVDDSTNTVLLSCVISESGMGLSGEEIEAMLSAYTRFDSRQKSDFKKLGMEFSICREILEMMGGNLKIESIANVGIAVEFNFINYIIDDAAFAQLAFGRDYNLLIYCKEAFYIDIWKDILADFKIYPQFVEGPSAFRNAIENKRYTHIFIDDVFYPILKDTISETGIEKNIYVVTEPSSVYSDFGDCKIIRQPLSCINISDALNDNWNEDNFRIARKKEGVIFPNARVLVVDDSIVNLRVIEGMLSTFKINSKVCKSGKKALDILDKEEFDLLIIDQRMPEIDGIELLHLIKNLENVNAIIPAICATADFGSEVEQMLKEEGFSDYLAKPIRRFYLERALRRFLPDELAVNVSISEEEENPKKSKDKKTETEEVKKSIDPQIIKYNVGIDNVGGSEDAFNEVVLAFYNEGNTKLEILPKLYESDLGAYVIDVHALKSSCAAIGAEGMSLLFKELEFAGRASNMEFIEGHSAHAFEEFSKVLVSIKGYLSEKGVLKEEEAEEETKELVQLSIGEIDEVLEALSKFNLKLCESKLKELSCNNYGSEYNKYIKEAFDSYEHFDYHKVKDDLNKLKEVMA